jgi:hypothetical protein
VTAPHSTQSFKVGGTQCHHYSRHHYSRVQVLGLRHQGALQAHPAAGQTGAAADIWAARHSLHCRVVDDEATKMPPAHPPVEVPLIG